MLILATLLLSGCADSTTTYYHKHPRELMREVVNCENNGGALANTPPCRKALRINAQLF
ncbi:MAG: EexN family lipoprotein [Acidiphilium sp.]|nr:EexN family lipoprotein [Acidiphilium sp.]